MDSLAVHAGRGDLRALGVHASPIDLSSTNPVADLDAAGLSYEAMAAGGHPVAEGGAVYARLWNPTVARFEDGLARLEGTEEAVAFASGMAAMTAVVLAAAQAGRRHVVAVRPLYGGTDHLLRSITTRQVSWRTADFTWAAAQNVTSAPSMLERSRWSVPPYSGRTATTCRRPGWTAARRTAVMAAMPDAKATASSVPSSRASPSSNRATVGFHNRA